MSKNDFIYLDYAAATPVDPRVFEAMKPYFSENFFNPSAPYLPAKRVREIYEGAKDELAHTIGAKGNDLVITAGATEANNLAFSAAENSEVLVLETEHASVLNLAKNFKYKTIKVDKNGRIDLKDFQSKLTEKVGFISISLCNNELGTIQPISDIVEIINQEKQKRALKKNSLPLIFHSDASQALNLMDVSVSRLGVDLLTINSAKVYGPKGIGALFVAHGIKLKPVVYGGGQEMGLRSGTENVAGLVGFATAAKLAKEHINGNRKKFEKLNKLFKETLLEKLDGKIEVKFLGNPKKQLANFVPICFDGLDAERIIFKLEKEKIFVSTGAACAASKGEKSHVLKAIGLSDSEIAGSLRISMGASNDEDQIKTAATKLAEVALSAGSGIGRTNSTGGLRRSRPSQSAEFPVTTGTRTVSAGELVCDSAKPTVYVGMSGGVDSSVSAVLLKEQGYRVVGVYMKNWSKDLPGMKCPWAEDLADAKRVATKLGIDFQIFDFENEYKQKVVDYMLDEFKKGNTPNPDIMCNQEIKFKLFYDIARENGADFIATGHYAKIARGSEAWGVPAGAQCAEQNEHRWGDAEQGPRAALCKATDENKDQTYFLYRISEDAIAHTIFPIGDMLKPDVKKLATKYGLDNAYKKESMGVCFVGDVGMKDFLKEYLNSTEDKAKYLKPGKIIDRETKEVVGFHDGAIFYTIGQRHGLNVGGGLPYYVVGKDMEKNEVYVSKNLNDTNLWTKTLELKDVILRGTATKVDVRLRHRAPLEPAILKNLAGDYQNGTGTATLEFENEIKRTASGQSAVIYQGDVCLGGGVLK